MYAKKLSTDNYIKYVISNLNSENIQTTANENAITQAVNQINTLHKEDDGYITIALKKGYFWYQHHYKKDDLKSNIGKLLNIDDINLYISPNSFYKPFRRIENIRKLNALYMDIDYYSIKNLKELSPEQIIYLLDTDYFKEKVPEASFIVITGRGIAIYWLIEPVPHMALPLWNAVQKFLLDELQNVGADPKSIDASRVMRLSGSLNQKNGKLAELLLYNESYKYNLREIQEEYMPALTPYIKNPAFKRKGRKSKIVKIFNCYSLHYARLMDLIKLQELRNGLCRNNDGTLTETGQREIMCFLYRYWSCCFTRDKKRALQDTLEFNLGFNIPLDKNIVRTQTIQAEKTYEEWLYNEFNLNKSKDIKFSEKYIDKLKHIKQKRKSFKIWGYNYKNKTLIELLCITDKEMINLKTIINEKEIKRRNNQRHRTNRRNKNGLTKKQQEKMDRLKLIKKLKDKGYKQNEISEKLSISVRLVQMIYKELRNKQKS